MNPVRPTDEGTPPGSRLAYQLVAVAAFASSWTGVYVGGLKLVDVLLVAAAVVGFIAIITDFVAPPRWVVAAGVAILVVLVLNRLFPVDAWYMMTRYRLRGAGGFTSVTDSPTTAALQWLVAIVVLPVVVSNVVLKARASVVPIMYAYAWGAGVCSMVAVTDFLGITAIGGSLIEFTVEQAGRQNGLASHVNNLGFAAALAAPISLHILRRHPVRGSFLLGLLVIGSLLSGSRAAQVGLVAVCLVTMVVVRDMRRVVWPFLYGLAWIGFIIYVRSSDLGERFGAVLRFGDNAGAAQSNEGRFEIAVQAIEDWRHSPVFGIGYGALTGAHSIYLQVLATGGTILAVGMLIFWLGLIRDARRVTGPGSEIGVYLLAAMVTWLACGAVENVLVERYLYFPVAAVVTLRLMRERTSKMRDLGSDRDPVLGAQRLTDR